MLDLQIQQIKCYTGKQKKFRVHILILPGPDVMYILSPFVCPGSTQISFYALWCWKKTFWCGIRGIFKEVREDLLRSSIRTFYGRPATLLNTLQSKQPLYTRSNTCASFETLQSAS